MISGSVTAISQSLQLRLSSVYLFAVSLMGIALVSGLIRDGALSVLQEADRWWEWAIGSHAVWLLDSQRWFAQHAGVCGAVSWVLVLTAAGVLAWQRDTALRTLTSPSLVLGLALGSASGVDWLGQLGVAIGSLIGLFVLARVATRDDSFDFVNFMTTLISILITVIYAPILVISWLTGIAGSEQEAIRRREVVALEKIADSFPNAAGASGANNIRRLPKAG